MFHQTMNLEERLRVLDVVLLEHDLAERTYWDHFQCRTHDKFVQNGAAAKAACISTRVLDGRFVI